VKLVERLNTFPVIAAGALLLAALFGIVIGLATADDPSPTMQQRELDEAPGDGRDGAGPLGDIPSSNRARDARRDPATNRTRDPATNRTRDPGTTDPADGGETTQPPIRETGEPRKLPEGRTDEMVAVEAPATAAGAIEVSVQDTNNNPLPFALLALDIEAGPLGWQLVPKQPLVVPETRGLFRYEALYAGSYRVRSLQANYRPVAAEVRLVRADVTEAISLTLEPLQYSQVEFFVKFEDGVFPEEVELRINKGGQEDNSGAGRFGTHENTGSGVAGGVIPPTRYRQKTATGGLVRLTLPVGEPTSIEFGAKRDEKPYEAKVTVTPTAGVTQQDVVLLPVEKGNLLPTGPAELGKLGLTLTVDGKVEEFTRVNLYQDINDFKYRPASTVEGNKYVWQNIFTGKWFVVAESAKFHAPFVQQVDVGVETVLEIDIKLGHLRVNAARVAGTPDPGGGEARYRVRLRPMGSGTIERAYNGNLTGKQSDFIDFYVPAGAYDVRVESPEQYPKLAVSPVEQTLTMTAGGDMSVTFNISSASTLKFQAVNAAGLPIANPEYLITFHAAGSVPESEKANVEKGGHDGRCETSLAPSGPVYVMIWTTSTDWNNPDKVFQIDLPAYGTKDLGAVVVQQ
jgi:hypothetical protein